MLNSDVHSTVSANQANISQANINRAQGCFFLSIFGAAWLVTGHMLSGTVKMPVLAVIATVAVAMLAYALTIIRQNKPTAGDVDLEKKKAVKNTFLRINLIQWGIIIAALFTLNAINRVEWMIPLTLLVVGLHFLPLVKLFNSPEYIFTGALLVIVALTYPWLDTRGSLTPIGPLLAGLTLWATTVYRLLISKKK